MYQFIEINILLPISRSGMDHWPIIAPSINPLDMSLKNPVTSLTWGFLKALIN